MRLLSTRRPGGGAATERLRAMLDRFPLDGLRPPASFGDPPPGTGAVPPVSAPLSQSHPAPPAASLRSSPRPPEDEDAADPGRAAGRADMPPAGRFDPGLPGARALAAVGVLAALVAGGYLWLSRPAPDPAPEPAAASLAVSPPASMSPAPSGPSAAATVVVHVTGKVRRPGVITLPAGARVGEAIKAAGGLRPGAGTGTLNLARRVVDGEQIPVGVPAAAAPPAPGTPTGATGAAPGTPLDLNAATAEQFQQLPGVGPVLAQRIVDYRTQHGGFRSVGQLREVSGIGERRFTDLRDLVRV